MPIAQKDLVKIVDVPKVLMRIWGVVRKRDTAYKWIADGSLTHDKKRVKLQTTKKLGQLFTTETWIRKFVTEIS